MLYLILQLIKFKYLLSWMCRYCNILNTFDIKKQFHNFKIAQSVFIKIH